MKEGLEKYFAEGGTPELPFDGEVENQTQEHAEKQLQQPEGVQSEQVEAQGQVEEQAEVQEEVIEIGDAPQVQEEPQEQPTLEYVEEEEVQKALKSDLPEGVDKLVEFINETGGSLQDYLQLNRDYDSLEEAQVLKEFYTQTKPHLDADDIDFLINKKLNISEDLDEIEQRERKISLKEDLSKAKAHLSSNKDRYYNELKATAQEPKVDKELIARQEKATQYFLNETDKVFEGFKGFDFSLGEGKPTVRYKVDDADKVKSHQSDLNNVIGGFLNEDGQIADAKAYHKALFAMQNADKLAQLFYEQGKADAIKEKSTDSKNIDFSPQLTPASSNEKLKPGQAREIESPNSGKTYGLNLKYNSLG